MFYSFTLHVPANTPTDSPIELDMELSVGTIRAVYIQFPIGTRALVHVSIQHEGTQFIPTNQDGDIVADGYTVPVEYQDFVLDKRSTMLRAIGWSEADTYDYDIVIFIALEDLPDIEPVGIMV